MSLRFHVGTDVGGTFTDLWIVANDGRSATLKAPTTTDVIGGLIEALQLAADRFGLSVDELCARIERFGHGTTVGLNALLTGRYAQTAVLTNEGFGDTLEIGRLRRQYSGLTELEVSDYYLRGQWPPLVSRRRIREIVGRIDVAGDVIQTLDETRAIEEIGALGRDGVEAVAVCTLWATANPAHEARLRELLHEHLPEAAVSVSHEVAATVGEYARMSTTAANAALKPVASHYVSRLGQTLRERGIASPVLMMTSAGGVVPGRYLGERPVMALFSGPSAGVMAAQEIGTAIGRRDLLTVDLGGTSFDVGLIVDGAPLMTSEISLAGADIRVPSIDVRSIGAGGGSIARVELGELLVGPDSAGANPGPACYGRGGTRPTATDADLVLGVLDPDNFVGGRLTLDVAAARTAIAEHVAEPLGVSVEEAAWGIREVLDNKMAGLLRQVTIARGRDPREFAIVAGGGGGPSHAWVLARQLGIREVIVPAVATGQSAYGTGTSDIRMNAERTIGVVVKTGAAPTDAQTEAVAGAIRGAAAIAEAEMAAAAPSGAVQLVRTLACCYRGQVSTLDIEVPDIEVTADTIAGCLQRFEEQYEQLFGQGAAFPEAGFMIVSTRATAIGVLVTPALAADGDHLMEVGRRGVIFDDPRAPQDTVIHRVERPAPGQVVAGPALIEYPGHTVVVPPGETARSDDHGNLIITAEEGR